MKNEKHKKDIESVLSSYIAPKARVSRHFIINKDSILKKPSKIWGSILLFVQPIIGYFVYKGYVGTDKK